MQDEPKDGLTRPAAWAALAVILCVGGLLRFWNIGEKELWLDECVSALAVSRGPATPRPLDETVDAVAAEDAHPPLYYVALNLATRLTGHDEAGLRVLSAAAGIGCIALVYAVGRLLLGRVPGLLAAGLTAVSSFHLYFAQEARLHALATLLVLALTYAFLRLLTARETSFERLWPWGAAYAVLATAALYTYYYTAFAIAAHLVAFLVLWAGARWAKDGARWLLRRREAAALWPVLLAAVVVAGVAFGLGWGGVVLDRLGSARQVGSSAYGPGHVLGALRQFVTGPAFDRVAGGLDRWAVATGWLAAALPFAGLACAPRRRAGAAVCLAVFLLVPFVCVVVVPRPHVFEPKHLVFIAPVLLLMLAGGWTRRRFRALTVVAVVLVGLLNGAANWVYFSPQYDKEPWRAAAGYLERRAKRGDVIVASPRPAMHPLRRYYQGPVPVIAADGPRDLGRVAALEPRYVWLVELKSHVAHMPRPVLLWLTTHQASAEALPPCERWRGFTGSPTEIRVRRFVYAPAGGQ
jgi:4-amino-4-deoxy-L-arabinose transferase-like glycosyltransferase